MNVVKIMGGLGNQMFQYAFSICCKHPCFLDKSWYLSKNADREYLLHHLNCKFNSYDEETPNQLTIRYEKQQNIYDESLLNSNNSYIIGYYQSYKYAYSVRDKLMEDFLPLDEPTTNRYLKMKDKILNSNSVSISIRRGDYLKLSDIYNILDLNYYQKCIDDISNKVNDVKFFIFSDDLEWCRENIKGKNFIYVDSSKYENRDELGIRLISCCKHNILANSTYCWWGAFLNTNKDKMIYIPSKWFSSNTTIDIIPHNDPNWISVS